MMTFLKVNGLCRAVEEPELRYTPNQKAVTSMTVATNRKWKDDGGATHEESCFLDCTVWGKLAESVAQYVERGDPLYIEGKLELERWIANDGTKRQKVKAVLGCVVFLQQRGSE